MNNYGYPQNFGNPYNRGFGMPNYMQPPYNQQPQQMVQQQMQQPMQYEVPIQDIRFVTSEEAKAFIVVPNSKALLIDKNNGIAHLKTADNMGQSVTEYFKFEAVNADGSPIKPKQEAQQVDYSDFIKKQDLAGFVTIEQYNTLLDRLDALQKQMVSKSVKQGAKNE